MKTLYLPVSILYLVLCFSSVSYASENGGKEGVTFTVGCFDVGASALQGRPGVISAQKGWHSGKEVNMVQFDPKLVSVPAMEKWLKDAGTYIGTESKSGQVHGKEKTQ